MRWLVDSIGGFGLVLLIYAILPIANAYADGPGPPENLCGANSDSKCPGTECADPEGGCKSACSGTGCKTSEAKCKCENIRGLGATLTCECRGNINV